ncbi:MAG: hypothetical protein Q7U98_18075 [Methylicorpusculum sp.]|uniref:hypothetical protein n=1 Tax=Methylicorpusculum sp. TaxID=2713644 RepID=UPI0027174B51|nr:hypothetical protein [Methylicorpusculum sp.]MDO8941065.1 hypothetical protein [Methylicorpusculum sp.]MDP2202336.1 hypothetical protein [Methylicorpusculum sp.]
MMAFYQKRIDRRSRTEIVNFLLNHDRYFTMRPWNRSTAYAHNIKLHRLGLTAKQLAQAYELMDVDYWDEIRWPIEAFTEAQGGCYTLCVNGRSGGYLVLYRSKRELTGHLSYCPSCGQRNFKKIPPIFNAAHEQVIAQVILNSQAAGQTSVYLKQQAIAELPISTEEKVTLIGRIRGQLLDCSQSDSCGVCKKPRRNYEVLPKRLSVCPGAGLDQFETFTAEDWSMSALRDRVELVCAFDAACDAIRSNFIALLAEVKVVNVTEYRPVQVKKLQFGVV